MNCYNCNTPLICGWKDLSGNIVCAECASKESGIELTTMYCDYCNEPIETEEGIYYTDTNGKKYCCELHALMNHGYEFVAY